jgi:hypothetical protein
VFGHNNYSYISMIIVKNDYLKYTSNIVYLLL